MASSKTQVKISDVTIILHSKCIIKIINGYKCFCLAINIYAYYVSDLEYIYLLINTRVLISEDQGKAQRIKPMARDA